MKVPVVVAIVVAALWGSAEGVASGREPPKLLAVFTEPGVTMAGSNTFSPKAFGPLSGDESPLRSEVLAAPATVLLVGLVGLTGIATVFVAGCSPGGCREDGV